MGVNGTTVFVSGNFQYLKSESRNFLMSIGKSDGLITSWNPSPDGPVYALELNGTSAYVGGAFWNIGGQPRNHIAEVNLSTGSATTWNPGANAAVRTLRYIGTTLHAGGDFTTIGGQQRNYLAALNNTNGNATAWNPKMDASVNDIDESGAELVVSGNFTFTNGELRNNLMAIDKATSLIKNWNPNSNGSIETIELNGPNAYVGGAFSSIGGQPRNNIAEISLTTGNSSTWNPNANSTVKTIRKFGNVVYAGGYFTTISGLSRNFLAGLNVSNGSATSWNPNADAAVVKLAVSDNVLYVAGDYSNIGGAGRNRLSSFALPSESLSDWNPSINGSVYDMQVTGSTIYIGGSFSEASGQLRNNIASYDKLSRMLKQWNPDVNGPVYSLSPIAQFVYATGSFTVANGQSCNGFTILNANTGFPQLYFPSVTGQIFSSSANDDKIYFGGNFSNIDNIPYGGLASMSYPANYFTPVIEDYNPKIGGDNGDVTMILNGNGFTDGTTVKLTRNGESDILLDNIYISDGIQITGTLDLRNVTLGSWNLIVVLPDGSNITAADTFEIQEGIAPEIWTEVVGFNQIRIGQWQSYNLVYGNTGNVDSHGTPVWLAVSDNAEIDLRFEFQKDYEHFNVPNDGFYDEVPNYFVVDTIMDIPGTFKLVGLYFKDIPANSARSLAFKVKMNAPGSFIIRSWAGAKHFGSPQLPWVAKCLLDVGAFAGFVSGCIPLPVSQAVAAAINAFDCTVSAYNAYEGFSNMTGGVTAQNVFKAGAILFTGTLDCAQNYIPGNNCMKGLTTLGKAVSLLNKSAFNASTSGGGSPTDYLPFLSNCVPPPTPPEPTPPIQTINSFDPNDKLGPLGSGEVHYLKKDRILPYIIRCENDPTATAAAQTVRIIDTLDQSVFDISKFELGFISIRDSIIPIPSGLKRYQTDIDLRPENNIIARIDADLDMATGVVTWEFTSLDPLTLLPTENPTAGFLPPNVNKPEGEAAVMFTIKTWDNISHDTQIKNKAYIYFDTNPPIITNEWLNTSDTIKPQSQMTGLSEQTSGLDITLNWTGSDIGSGVRSYAIYYSTNGGPFELLTPYQTDTTYMFTGEMNNTYAFFTIATDNVGNVEDMKTVGDAVTTLGVINSNIAKTQIYLYPNPNDGNFNLSIETQQFGDYHIDILDFLGRKIIGRNVMIDVGNTTIPINLDVSGIYFVTLSNQNMKITKKVVVQ